MTQLCRAIGAARAKCFAMNIEDKGEMKEDFIWFFIYFILYLSCTLIERVNLMYVSSLMGTMGIALE